MKYVMFLAVVALAFGLSQGSKPMIDIPTEDDMEQDYAEALINDRSEDANADSESDEGEDERSVSDLKTKNNYIVLGNCPAHHKFASSFKSSAPNCYRNLNCGSHCFLRNLHQEHKRCHDLSWSHRGYQNGPQCWNVNYRHCSGSRQSPINIRSHNVVQCPTIGSLCLHTRRALTVSLFNTGHDLKATLDPPSADANLVSGGPLGNDVYRVNQFHFHFAANSYLGGSEHTIDGRHSNVEMHIVMVNKKYGSFEAAKEMCDGLAVIAVMLGHDYRFAHTRNAVGDDLYHTRKCWKKMFYKLHGQTYCDEKMDPYTTDFWLKHLLPSDYARGFYTYKGSLTTPPCSESVTWIVMKSGFFVDKSFLYSLHGISTNLPHRNWNPMQGNRRPIQPLNGRRVFVPTGNIPCRSH